jgi:hypothetical protein
MGEEGLSLLPPEDGWTGRIHVTHHTNEKATKELMLGCLRGQSQRTRMPRKVATAAVHLSGDTHHQ